MRASCGPPRRNRALDTTQSMLARAFANALGKQGVAVRWAPRVPLGAKPGPSAAGQACFALTLHAPEQTATRAQLHRGMGALALFIAARFPRGVFVLDGVRVERHPQGTMVRVMGPPQ